MGPRRKRSFRFKVDNKTYRFPKASPPPRHRHSRSPPSTKVFPERFEEPQNGSRAPIWEANFPNDQPRSFGNEMFAKPMEREMFQPPISDFRENDMGMGNADDIPEFDPLLSEITTKEWTDRVRRTKTRNNWSEHQTMAIISSKLRNKANDWFYKQNEAARSDLEVILRKLELEFHYKMNFCNRLFAMVNRNRQPQETFTQYFEDKLKWTQVCKLTEIDAVSCIIEGLESPKATHIANQWFEKGPRTLDLLRQMILHFDFKIPRDSEYAAMNCYMCIHGLHIKFNCNKYKKRYDRK